MASTRAPAVAEVLWELKRADKVAKFTAIAGRAGFNAGSHGKAMETCLKTIRKEWPHLDWWRAIRDDGAIDPRDQQAVELKAWGAELSNEGDGATFALIDESKLMIWDHDESAAPKRETAHS